MSYSAENFRVLKAKYEEKQKRAKEEARLREEEVRSRIPAIAQIDALLAQTAARIFAIIAKGGRAQVKLEMEALQAEVEQLGADRAVLLTQHGYPADYTAVRYECPACSDSGFVGVQMCECMRRALVFAGYESSGIGKLFATQNFDTFSLDYYQRDAETYAQMQAILEKCRSYADTFRVGESENLLFCGKTGLGKTHLSTAIAKRLIEQGFDVVYETAQNVFSDFEADRFPDFGVERKSHTARYFEADLLIVDDLGTEAQSAFATSCLYNIINTRLNQKRPMLFSTNLSHRELHGRYADRITSRLFGEFLPLMFEGEDIRAQKLR